MADEYFEDVMSEQAANKLYYDIMQIAAKYADQLNDEDEKESA